MSSIIFPSDLTSTDVVPTRDSTREAAQYNESIREKYESGADVDVIVILDARKVTGLQINANSQAYTIKETMHLGKGITDIESASVPWITFKAARTTDYMNGEPSNIGLVALWITSDATLSADFEIHVSTQPLQVEAR